MGRTWALGLAAASLLLGAGCSQSGSYRLSWVFLLDNQTQETQSSAVGCGQHGVDSILVNGTDGGDSLRIIALCVPGSFTGTAHPGTWTFTFQMLDAGGFPVRPLNAPLNSPYQLAPLPTATAAAASIVAGGPTAQFPVQLDVTGLSACHDGIDNDGDGLVDTGHECDAGAPGAPDSGTSSDSGTLPDSGTSRDSGAPRDSGTFQDSGAARDAAPREGGTAAGGDGGHRDASPLDARG
jgi:hypothetical protein